MTALSGHCELEQTADEVIVIRYLHFLFGICEGVSLAKINGAHQKLVVDSSAPRFRQVFLDMLDEGPPELVT